jgi:hypothetical protein
MNDSDNNNNTDNKAGLPKATYTKPNNDSRTSDIYKRFLNRVEGIESYPSLSDDELQLFNDGDIAKQALNSDSIEIDLSDDVAVAVVSQPTHTFSDTDAVDVLSVDDVPSNANHADIITEPKPDLIAKDTNTTQNHKPANGSKLLIIGIVSGLLLSVVIVVLLKTMGYLSTPVDTPDSNSAEIIPSSTSIANDKPPAIVDTKSAPDLNPKTTVPVEPQVQSDVLIDEDKAVVSPIETPAATSDSNVDAAITYDDFREEAQTTLYRETTD